MGDADDIFQGKVYGPYLTPDKFTINANGELVDSSRRPVLYIPASPARPNVSLPNGYVTAEAGTVKPLFASNKNADPST